MFKKRQKEKSTDSEIALSPVPAGRIGLTIGAKLVGLVAVLLLSSVATIVTLSTQLFTDDSTSMIQQMNADKAGSLAIQLREQLEGMTEKMRVMGTILLPDEKAAPGAPSAYPREQLLSEYYVKDKDFVGVYVFQRQPIGPFKSIAYSLSPEERAQDVDGTRTLASLSANPDFNPALVAQGEVQISTLSVADGSPGVAVSVPFIHVPGTRPEEGQFSHTVTAVIRQSKFMKAFGESDIITTYLVDRKGKLLAHPETARVASGELVADVGVVRLFLEGKANNQQTRYIDPRNREAKLGAFKVVGFGGLGVVAEVAEAKAFEAAEKVQRRSLYVALFVLSVAFFVGYVFSETLARPIRGLVEVARRISSGDFNIAIKPRGRDEVARLSLAFNEMAQGLAERDRVKATFNKFHNKEIAEKLLSGEVKLGGERKEATIFFSDVRGFTAMSETMDPEQVVEMLNEYMTRMVSIIRKHNGVVDKYVGDAIMALWGVPVPHPEDTLNALRACIEMRRELAALNELRLSRGQNELRIGMGLNHGVVIAGNIGSDEKMEYTVIGDAVNTASRMESMTKEYGTDLLVPKAVADRIEGRFILERAKDARVKGKTEALQVFKVKGYIDEQGQSVVVETAYSSYASEKSDKAVHDPAEAAIAPVIPMPKHQMEAASVPKVLPQVRPVARVAGDRTNPTLRIQTLPDSASLSVVTPAVGSDPTFASLVLELAPREELEVATAPAELAPALTVDAPPRFEASTQVAPPPVASAPKAVEPQVVAVAEQEPEGMVLMPLEIMERKD